MSLGRLFFTVFFLLCIQQCTQHEAELHKVRAAKCIPPGDPAYDVNLGEPKCPSRFSAEQPANTPEH